MEYNLRHITKKNRSPYQIVATYVMYVIECMYICCVIQNHFRQLHFFFYHFVNGKENRNLNNKQNRIV